MKKYRQKLSSATFAKNVWYNHILLACSSVDYQFYCDKSWQTFNSLETCLYLLFFFSAKQKHLYRYVKTDFIRGVTIYKHMNNTEIIKNVKLFFSVLKTWNNSIEKRSPQVQQSRFQINPVW